ncbi:rhodanese-like domain-containing protein [Labilibaculum antarcticum]|uniref:Rhodanese-like domain-containing protein n=1 Tax=Labilibaculum antarcticum TaxID=1717717 RepID=A0A1Y1CML3_9BACT|nr:rhodanese-like domain-containing protein [Labilibaculum antarcticum]BAX81524.1 rhodanese-like domain-containing protein [Labilibaculum antarcticum]
MKMRLIIASVLIPLGIIIAAVPENKTKQFRLTAGELLNEVREGTQFISTDQIADMLVQKDPSLQLIDVRTQDEYEKYSLPGSVNVPLSDLLSEEWKDFLDQGVKMNVFYSNGNLKANEAWMLTRQLGFKNNYVLQGGLNYWAETIMNPTAPKSVLADDEIAKYDFRKGASMALGGGSSVVSSSNETKSVKPPIVRKKKKKRVAGGC